MKITSIAFGLLLAITTTTSLRAQVSAFTYQGRLNLNGTPATGHYDFMFRLMNDPTNGVAAPVIPVNLAVPVTNGLFTTGIDFSAENFDGANRWLEINVRTNGGGAFTTLSPRQLLTPTPYAISANTASNLLGAVPASQISGTIPNASLPASPSFSGTVTANNFSGNGANVMNVNAATLSGLTSADLWKTTGNTGTTANTNFLGTIDGQPLEFRVNGMRVLRLEDNVDNDDPYRRASGAPNFIGGSPYNMVSGIRFGVFIGGGGATNYYFTPHTNLVSGNFGAIVGGRDNAVQADEAIIGGGVQNTIGELSETSVIAGGRSNTVAFAASRATISGGSKNMIWVGASDSAIGGGEGNRIESEYGSIGGGLVNRIGAFSSWGTIPGGLGNTISSNAPLNVIVGGMNNDIGAESENNTIGGGSANIITGGSIGCAVVCGQNNNIIQSGVSVIGGGLGNAITASDFSTISGGLENHIVSNFEGSAIGGGYGNTIEAMSQYATIAGGRQNVIGTNTTASVIGGGEYNRIEPNGYASTISGGSVNAVGSYSQGSVIAGGVQNETGSNTSYVAIGGGRGNIIAADSPSTTIAGGADNIVRNNAAGSVIAGGENNEIGTNSNFSAIGGGSGNTVMANSQYATLPGGELNTATNWAFAAGRAAKAMHSGAFVWADSGVPFIHFEIASTNANSVTMRASGGYRLFSDLMACAGVYLAPGSGSWTAMSDRNAKENFHAADVREVLEKVVALPMQTWNYKSQDASIRHVGPMAQDFKAAFQVGESDTGIATVDADGVALAAIQGLNQKFEEREALLRSENAQLQKKNAELETRLGALEKLMNRLTVAKGGAR